ncbi:hypothetical protein ACQP2E_34850 [Actinoplanes sp. CA-015351]|uniref:hypothetical protein n=1 Tax=Actinoplanes sp. CA-015351 TaxID=3239897 RepID=UPI003D97EB41
MRKFTKRSVALITAGVVAVGGGAAYAAWSLGGSGTATASAGTVQTLSVAGVSTTPLVPGTKTDVTLTLTNPNKFPVVVTSISYSGFSSNNGDCAGSNIVATGAAIPTGVIVPAATSTAPGTGPITHVEALRMVGNAAEECQAATFSFTATVGADSAAS